MSNSASDKTTDDLLVVVLDKLDLAQAALECAYSRLHEAGVEWEGDGFKDMADAVIAKLEHVEWVSEQRKVQAQIWKGEAMSMRSIIYDCYRAVSGKRGEPGNWHGAVPVEKKLRRLENLGKFTLDHMIEVSKRLIVMGPIHEAQPLRDKMYALTSVWARLNRHDGWRSN